VRILVCGWDGYIGYPLVQNLLVRGHRVFGVDYFYRRRMVRERGLESIIPIASYSERARALQRLGEFDYAIIDIAEEYPKIAKVFRDFRPEAIVNLAQQPSAPYSMIDPEHARFTIRNNVQGALNLLWAMRDYAPESHIVTLGTMGEYGCFDEKTEILTEDGWKSFKDLTLNDKVATRSCTSRKIVFKKPRSIIKYHYKGKMYLQQNTRIDFCVTLDHRIFVQKRSNRKYKELVLKSVDEVKGKRMVYDVGFEWEGVDKKYFVLPPTKMLYTGPKTDRSRIKEAVLAYLNRNSTFTEIAREYDIDYRTLSKYVNKTKQESLGVIEGKSVEAKKIPMDLWVSFFGWYISEGSVPNRKDRLVHYGVVVKQKGKWVNEIRAIFKKMSEILNCKMSETSEGDKIKFTLWSKQLAEYLRTFGHAKDKYIPKELKNLNKRLLRKLFEGLIKGDGEPHGRGWRYYTISKRLADDVQEIALKLGYGAIISKKSNGYYVHICRTPRVHVNHGKQTDRFVDYDGMVYDVDVGGDGIVFVRRNGKPVWSGNCPNMPIPEGFFEVEYEGMRDILPFPKQTNSVYHTSKVMTSDLAWFAARVWELRITDIMQGVVYGTRTDTMTEPVYRTRFDIGECFGTNVNRAVACAVVGHPIVVYGSGFQRRGYIQLRDSVACLTLVTENHPTDDDSIHGYRVINQFDESYSCEEIAYIVKKVGEEHFGLNVKVKNIPNPRIEPEVHYYNPHHEKLYKMGWRPTKTIEEGLIEMFEDLIPLKDRILKFKDKILPKIKWRPEHVAIKKEVIIHG